MTDAQAAAFLAEYFKTLFIDRDLARMSDYLHPDYWDDDIGDPKCDHIENGKQYLLSLFESKPNVGVIVKRAVIEDEVITAYLEWYDDLQNPESLWLKGIGLFEMDRGKIRKRHTYIYQKKG